jgi:hypothetical protein
LGHGAELPACSLGKIGRAIVFYVEGFDAVSFESKGYGYDLGMLEGQFREWGVQASGPVFEKLHHELQAAYGVEDQEAAEGEEEADDSAVLALLEDPALLGRLVEAVTAPESADPLLGEDDNAVQLTLVIQAKDSAEVRGLTAAGKNALVDHVLSVYRTWKKTAGMSDKALRHLPEGIKILYIIERRGIESGQSRMYKDETTSEYDVKVSISEGKIAFLESRYDQKAKKWVTVEIPLEIDSFILTTTEVTGPAENENRIHVLQVHDDEAMNARVRDSQLDIARSFSWNKKDYTADRELVTKALAYVDKNGPKPDDVILPVCGALRQMLSAKSSAVRRSTPKLIKLVKACARLHFLQRELTADGRGVVATPEDLAFVLYTGAGSLEASLSAIPEKAKIVLDICRELEKAKLSITTERIRANAGDKLPQLGSKKTIRRLVGTLSEAGALNVSSEKEGKFNVYEVEPLSDSFVHLDVAKVLRDAWAEYDDWVAAGKEYLDSPLLSCPPVSEQTEQNLTPIDGQSTNLADNPRMSSNPDSVGSGTRGHEDGVSSVRRGNSRRRRSQHKKEGSS